MPVPTLHPAAPYLSYPELLPTQRIDTNRYGRMSTTQIMGDYHSRVRHAHTSDPRNRRGQQLTRRPSTGRPQILIAAAFRRRRVEKDDASLSCLDVCQHTRASEYQ